MEEQQSKDYYYTEDVFFDPQLFNGRVVSNRYLLCRFLGSGAYCGVFLAFDFSQKEFVCVKLYELETEKNYKCESIAF